MVVLHLKNPQIPFEKTRKKELEYLPNVVERNVELQGNRKRLRWKILICPIKGVAMGLVLVNLFKKI